MKRLDPKQFEHTKSAPTRRVVPEETVVEQASRQSSPASAPEAIAGTKSPEPPAEPPAPAAPEEDAPATKAAKKSKASSAPGAGTGAALLLLLLLWLIGSNVTLATTTFWFTNDFSVPVYTMFYSNTSSGYVYYMATNTLNGASNQLSTTFAVQGVAVQGTNASLARLVPLGTLPTTGSSVSNIASNTATMAAGIAQNTTTYGTNISAGSGYTSLPPGTNAVSTSAFNTNLP